jgi:prephenate dehydrogenase
MPRLLVIGTGLIGGSFALAMRRAGRFDSIAGYDTDAAALAEAEARGIIDHAASDPSIAAAAADAVLIAVPPFAIAAAVRRALTACRRSTPIFDAGSVKGSVIAALRGGGDLPAQFVPTHPMAGSERQGPGAADATLFVDRHVILTPEPETDPAAVAAVRDWWGAAGATVIESSAAVHDEMVALTSHLPHLLAHTFMEWAARPRSADPADFAGPGLRDFTRIAASDPVLWRQIFAANRDALLHEFDGFAAALEQVGELLRTNRFDELQTLLAKARNARADLLERADDGA